MIIKSTIGFCFIRVRLVKLNKLCTFVAVNGRELKALELPGSWNGAMSDCNTIFVEVHSPHSTQ
jgi:hypothetical protein